MKMQMDKGIFRAAAVLLCAGGLMVSSAMAQQDAPPPPQDGQQQGPPPVGPGARGERGMNPERRIEMLQKHLNLTNDQTAQMRTIFAEQRSKMEALRSNTSLAPQDKHAQMMAIHEDGTAKVHAILTPDQSTKFDAMEAKQRERMEEHRRGEQGPPPPAGSSPVPAPQQ